MPYIANRQRRELLFFVAILLISTFAFTVYVDQISFYYEHITIPQEYKIHKQAILNNHHQINQALQVKLRAPASLSVLRSLLIFKSTFLPESLQIPWEKSSKQRLSLIAFQQTNSRYR